MGRLLIVLASLLLGWLGAANPPAALAAEPSAVHVYDYDGHRQSATPSDIANERGPPVAGDRTTTCDAVDFRSNGIPACSDALTPRDTTTYDVPAPLVQNADVTTPAGGPVQVLDASTLSVERLRVAANSGDDLIRLSTKDSWANLKTLDDHFARHGADFGATSADDYARMGSEFFQRGGAQHLPTKIAPDGTIRMFDPATNTFGSFAPNGMTKTLFKPTSPDYWSRQPGVLQ